MPKTLRFTIYSILALYMLPNLGQATQLDIRNLISKFSPPSQGQAASKKILIRYSFAGKKRLKYVLKCTFLMASFYYYYYRNSQKLKSNRLNPTLQAIIYSCIILADLALVSATLKALFYDVYIESKLEGVSLPNQCLKKGFIGSLISFFTEFSLTRTEVISYDNIALVVEKTEREYSLLGVPTQKTFHVLKLFCHDGRLYELRVDRLSREDYAVHILTDKLRAKGIEIKERLAAT